MDLPNQELPNNKTQETTNEKEPLRLTSPAPIADRRQRYNKLYQVLVPIGAVIGVFAEGLQLGSILIGALPGALVAWILKEAMLRGEWLVLRKQPFALDNKVPYDKLIEKLIPVLTPLGMIIEKNPSGEPTITYKRMIYDVIYGEDNTFTIWWRQSLLRTAFNIRTNASNYRETVIGMGIIGYYVQQICSTNTQDTERYDTDSTAGGNQQGAFEKTVDGFSRIPNTQTNVQGGSDTACSGAVVPTQNVGNTAMLRCPRCGGTNCTPIVETSTSGKGFSASKGCCGYIILGPLGLLCGACGRGQRTTSTTYWMCSSCGNKFQK